MSKGKGQQVIEHNSFLLNFQLPDGKDTLQTAQKCYQLKVQSFCKCYLKYMCCLHRHLYHKGNALNYFDMAISYTPIFFLKALCTRLLIQDLNIGEQPNVKKVLRFRV